MSVKRPIPAFEPGQGLYIGAPRVVARARPPRTVEFRSGADLSAVVEAIMVGGSVSVDAAPAAGKTTRLPHLLAAASGKLIVHVFPNDFLAADQYDFSSKQPGGENARLALEPAAPFPVQGWAFTSAASLVARWLEAGAVTMPDCIVYHDEAHESDAFTHLVRALAPKAVGVHAYVRATATHSGGGHRSMEVDAPVKLRNFPDGEFLNKPWDVNDVSKPWCVDNFTGNCLIYEENAKIAKQLVSDYSIAGCNVFRFHARMPLKKFQDDMRLIRSADSAVNVIIADSTFRSGFCFPVNCVIDCGEVSYATVRADKPIISVRRAFQLEMHQGACRAGRVGREPVTVWRPDIDFGLSVCDLEPCDMEVAALLFRALGYVVPRELAGCRMASGKVPRNLSGVLREQTPLAILSDMQLIQPEEAATKAGRRSPFLKEDVVPRYDSWDAEDSRVSSDMAFKYGEGSLVREKRPSAAEPRDEAAATASFNSGAATAALEAMMGSSRDDDRVQVGNYYYAVGVPMNAETSLTFPDGADSVLRVMSRDKSGVVYEGYSPATRGNALWLLLMRYSYTTCEMRALGRAIATAKAESSGVESVSLIGWATRSSERLAELANSARVVLDHAIRLAKGFCVLKEHDSFKTQEDVFYAEFVAPVRNMPRTEYGAPTDYVQYMTGFAESLSSGSEDYDPGGEWAKLSAVPMPVRGRGSRAVPPIITWLAGGPQGQLMVKGSKRRSR